MSALIWGATAGTTRDENVAVLEKDRVAYRARVRRRSGLLCQWWNSVFEKPARRRAIALVCFFYLIGTSIK